ncbi:MAG: MBL fold metallo-hydrolase [Enterobacterales bacterium]|nr:MBL fold metallo-hydrolase [Enterobacterales bacterium]
MFSKNMDEIQYCSLGSGSKGNATLVAFGDTLIMVDCGFSLKECVKRLELKGIQPQQITAILVTHEHADHIAGVARLSNCYSIPVWLSKGTSLHKASQKIEQCNIFNSHSGFSIQQIKVEPVHVPHDAREATQFIFSAASCTLGLLTDVGTITPHIVNRYQLCDALLLEFNYDHQMLMQGRYPYSLKQRVSGELGHLSNQQAFDFLSQLNPERLFQLVIMHVSQQNNSSDIITNLLESLDKFKDLKVEIASQVFGFEWRAISKVI